VIPLARLETELGEDVVDVLFDRAAADHQRFRDRGVGQALGHQRQHLALAGGQGTQRVAAAGQQLTDDLGVEDTAAIGHPLQRPDELIDVRHPVLEQVADPVRAVGDELGGVPFLHPLGEHEHADAGPLVADQQRRPQPLIGERGRHPDVDHAHVGDGGGDRPQELLGVAVGRDDLMAGLGQQPGQSLPQQHRILGDHDPHGSTAEMIVGPPDGDSTERVPSTPATRSARPDSPAPPGSAPPIPSSLITTVSVPG
jgi:hypothetical protein